MSHFFHNIWETLKGVFGGEEFEHGVVEVGPGDPADDYRRHVHVHTRHTPRRVWFNLECCGHPVCGERLVCCVGPADPVRHGFHFTVRTNSDSCVVRWFASR